MIFGRDKVYKEIRKLAKFFIVGSTTFVFQTLLYIVFSRWLLTYAPRTISYALAILYAIVYNYSLNRVWTFGDQGTAKGSAKRYAYVAITASIISSVLFWVGHDLLDLYDLYVVIGVNLMIPFYTFVAHRKYTFHPKPVQVLRRRS